MIQYFLVILGIVGLLGGVSFALVLRSKITGGLRKFLLLTAGSVVGFFVCVILHNLLYALALLTTNIPILHYFFEVLHVIFFLIAIPLCPIGFLVGLIGSATHLCKRCKERKSGNGSH